MSPAGATLKTADYPTRNRRDGAQSGATVWFGSTDTQGARATLWAAGGTGCPLLPAAFPRPNTSEPSPLQV